jgi:hypothetical protein
VGDGHDGAVEGPDDGLQPLAPPGVEVALRLVEEQDVWAAHKAGP